MVPMMMCSLDVHNGSHRAFSDSSAIGFQWVERRGLGRSLSKPESDKYSENPGETTWTLEESRTGRIDAIPMRTSVVSPSCCHEAERKVDTEN